MVRVLQPRWLRPNVCVFMLAIFISAVLATGEAWNVKHEEGRCAIRGQCGKQSFFGGQLPCPDNGMAEQPREDARAKLVAICGDKWSTGPVCCDADQVSAMNWPYRKFSH